MLAGASAGSLCWHLGGPTDSYRNALDPFDDALGFLPFSNGVHDDFPDQPRRATYRSIVAAGVLADGYASEDGVGLHYVDTELHEAVTVRPGACACARTTNGRRVHRQARPHAETVCAAPQQVDEEAGPPTAPPWVPWRL